MLFLNDGGHESQLSIWSHVGTQFPAVFYYCFYVGSNELFMLKKSTMLYDNVESDAVDGLAVGSTNLFSIFYQPFQYILIIAF